MRMDRKCLTWPNKPRGCEAWIQHFYHWIGSRTAAGQGRRKMHVRAVYTSRRRKKPVPVSCFVPFESWLIYWRSQARKNWRTEAWELSQYFDPRGNAQLLLPLQSKTLFIFQSSKKIRERMFIQFSIHTRKGSRLGQRHGIYEKWYMYTFMKAFFQDKSIHIIFTFQTQQLESYSWFIFLRFDLNIVLNDILCDLWVWREYLET